MPRHETHLLPKIKQEETPQELKQDQVAEEKAPIPDGGGKSTSVGTESDDAQTAIASYLT